MQLRSAPASFYRKLSAPRQAAAHQSKHGNAPYAEMK
jgi:hypothetical protein